MQVQWLRAALRNVEAAHEYLSRTNPLAARDTVLRIDAAVAQIGEHPFIGRPGRVKGTREFVVIGTSYVIAYRVKGDAVEILRVLHGARQWPRRL
jgi:addiction module RelE/StbE family toxin